MLGYIAEVLVDKRVVATVEIVGNHDVDREGIIDKMHATYKTSSIKVLKIEDSDGKEYESAREYLSCIRRPVLEVGNSKTYEFV